MRVFRNFDEAKNEMARDLNELGVTVRAGYQSLEVGDNPNFETKELQNYDYRVLRPSRADLEPKTADWCHTEWADRVNGILGDPVNPGRSWKLRPEVWEPLLEPDYYGMFKEGQQLFSYTYSERLCAAHVDLVLLSLMENPGTRQAYISIWNPILDPLRLGKRRVPCSLGYQLIRRGNLLHMTYHMRSSDFVTHFDNDCWLALRLLEYMAEQLQMEPGSFTHNITSLHVYAADVEGVF